MGKPCEVIPLFRAARAKGKSCFLLLHWGKSQLPQLDSIYVLKAKSFSQIQKQILADEPNMILLDADEGGLETLQKLRPIVSVPIVLIAPSKSKASDWIIKQAYQLGIDDILYPPFTADDVIEIGYVLTKLYRSRDINIPSLSE